MKIDSVHLSRIQVPLRLAFASANGIRKYYQKTVVRLGTKDGLTGYGETDGSDEGFARVCEISSRLLRHDFSMDEGGIANNFFEKFRTSSLFDRIASGGLEVACWDLLGKIKNQPIHLLLGGRYRDEVDMVCELSAVPFSSSEPDSLFKTFLSDPGNIDKVVQAGVDEVTRSGYRTLKQKSVGNNPDWDLRVMTGFREALGPDFNLRHDPNGAYSPEEAITLYRKMDRLNLQWFEDPTSGINGLRRVRDAVDTRLATNMFAIEFNQLKHATEHKALDVIGIDPFHWAGLENARDAITICRKNGLDIFCHHFLDLGITTAAMLHLAASIPELPNGMDTSLYLQGTDIIQGGEFKVANGTLRVPTSPGLGVTLDEVAVKQYVIDEYRCRANGNQRFKPAAR